MLLVTAMAGLATGCVWNPSDQSTQSRFSSVPIQGWAQTPGATIEVSVFNHETGTDDVVEITTSSSTPMFSSPELYAWDAGWKVFEKKYWYPPSWECSTGMLRMRVTEDGERLATFTEEQQDCVLDEVNNGDHPVNAAQDCGYQQQIVIFSPSDC